MGDKRLEGVIARMLQQAGTPDPQILAGLGGAQPPPEIDMVEALAIAMQQLEMGVMQMAQGQQAMGSTLDYSRLTVYLLINLLIEKEIFSKEEWEERYKTDVTDRMAELQKQMQERLRQQRAEQQAAAENEELHDEPPPKPTPPEDRYLEEDELPSTDSDTILASERMKKKNIFPTDQDEE